MKEVFTMWRHTQMVVLVALTAAIYAATLIPTQFLPIIPGFTNIRPANVFPFVFGLLFGPAGAWGAAIGNLINDFFGTLGPGSIGGFIGNFFLGYLPYKMWGAFFRRGEDMEPNLSSRKKVAVFVAVVVLASVVCAVWIAWFNDLLGFVPFAALSTVIAFNNLIAGIVLGPIFLLVLYPRVRRWGLLWTEIMRPEEVSAARFQTVGNVLVWVGGIGGLALGIVLGLGLFDQGFAAAGFAPDAGGAGGATIGLALLPFVALTVIGGLLLGGREQVEAAQSVEETDAADQAR
jgi:energy-coupling factor transport system substrate-specific component